MPVVCLPGLIQIPWTQAARLGVDMSFVYTPVHLLLVI